MSATRAVIDFIRDASIEDMPERLLSEGRRCVLDGVGVILDSGRGRSRAARAQAHGQDHQRD